MLLKEPQARPTMTEIITSSIVQKHMALLIEASCSPKSYLPNISSSRKISTKYHTANAFHSNTRKILSKEPKKRNKDLLSKYNIKAFKDLLPTIGQKPAIQNV